MTTISRATPATIAQAAALLRAGKLVAFPTETVYGLGADASSDEAVATIYAAKGRPSFNPLIAHVDSLAGARRQGVFGQTALRLAEAFWPGPLTLVVPAAETCTVSLLARAGLDSVALRVPAHPVGHQLIEAAGVPVAAPSANRSGRISPTRAEHVAAELDGRIDLILDGGPCAVGLESTVVSCVGRLALLRPGGIARARIEAVLGQAIEEPAQAGGAPTAPGMLLSHYAPQAGLRLDALDVGAGEAVLDFGGALAGARRQGPYLDLSPGGDPAEAASNLFAYLRDLDRSGVAAIAVAPVPAVGLGEAIRDRLKRAAAPRA